MNEDVLEMSTELAEELSHNRATRMPVDPRTIPTRFSLLKTLALSPAHYLEAAQQAQDDDDSMAARMSAFASDRKEAYRIGGAIHAMLTGTGEIIEYAARRDPRSKAWQEFQANAAAKGVVEILSPKEMQIVRGVTSAILVREDAMRLLFDGTTVEKRIDWRWMGKSVRSTPDAYKPGDYIVDLKSCVSSEPGQFARQARRLFYHAQADLYRHAMAETGIGEPGEAFIVAVEKTRPHPVTIFRFGPDMIELGGKMNRLWIERLLACEAANAWPVYAPAPAVVDLELEEDEWP